MSDAAQRRAFLEKVPLFARLATEQLDELAAAARTRRLAPREELFHKGDRPSQVYVVASGRLKVSTTSPDGHEVLLNLVDEGEVVGEFAILCGGRRTATVTAIEASELVVLDRRDFVGFLRGNAEVAVELLGVLAERLVRISEFAEDAVLLGFSGRLAKKLLYLAERYGETEGESIRIRMHLSQSELGEMVGSSRESVNKQLRVWGDEGLLRTERGEITLLRPAELERLAGLIAS
jgi:CRP-like cAMP-binding protein